MILVRSSLTKLLTLIKQYIFIKYEYSYIRIIKFLLCLLELVVLNTTYCNNGTVLVCNSFLSLN